VRGSAAVFTLFTLRSAQSAHGDWASPWENRAVVGAQSSRAREVRTCVRTIGTVVRRQDWRSTAVKRLRARIRLCDKPVYR